MFWFWSQISVQLYIRLFVLHRPLKLGMWLLTCSTVSEGNSLLGKFFSYTKLNVCVSGYCRANKYRWLNSELMKILTVSELKSYEGCSSFRVFKIRKINSLTPRVIAWIEMHVTLFVVWGDIKPYWAISMNYFLSFPNCS